MNRFASRRPSARGLSGPRVPAHSPWLFAGLLVIALGGLGIGLNAQTVDTLLKAGFIEPNGAAADRVGSFYVSDSALNGVTRISATGSLLGISGGNGPGARDGDAGSAQFFSPKGLVYARGGVVVADSGNHVIRFIAGDGTVSTLAGAAGVPGAVDGTNAFSARFRFPQAVAADAAGNLFIADSKNHSIRKLGLDGHVTTLVGSAAGLYEPSGLALDDQGGLWIADTRNHSIRRLGSDGKLVLVAGGDDALSSGSQDASDGLAARFAFPRGLLWVGGNVGLLVCDTGNSVIRRVYPSATAGSWSVTTFLGIPGVTGTVDGPAATATFSAPSAVVFNPDTGSYLIVDGGNRAIRRYVPASSSTGGNTGGAVKVNPPEVTPATGYYPMGIPLTVTSDAPSVFFTTDGSDPTPESSKVSMANGVGTIDWRESTRDLSSLRVRAYVGTNASPVTAGVPVPTNQVGVVRDLVAGPGSMVVIPVVANLTPKTTLRSLQFRFEVVPNGGAPSLPPILRLLPVGNNDFVPVAGPGIGSVPASLTVSSYSSGRAQGLAIAAIGTNAAFQVQNFAAVAMVAVPVPPDAAIGQTYSIRVLDVTGTSDGVQADLPLQPLGDRLITVGTREYLVGDSSSGGWYDAGDFGNGILNNSDVNNAFYAALGLRIPFAFSDAFDAMDAFPVDSAAAVGGDGEIRFLDWQRILRRSLHLENDNWIRSWSVGGVRVARKVGAIALASANSSRSISPARTGAASAFPSSIDAVVGAGTVGRAVAGQEVRIPIYARVTDSRSLSGLLFSATVVTSPGSPDLEVPMTFLPDTTVPVGSPVNPDSHTVAYGWNLGAFNPPLTGSNLLGHLVIRVPQYATSGSSWTVRFNRADGSPDADTAYTFATEEGGVWAYVDPVAPADGIPADWKVRYFGSAFATHAQASADPDRDGYSNLQEYLAGTDPTDPASRLRLDIVVQGGDASRIAVLAWTGVVGRHYSIERSLDLIAPSWVPVVTGVVGTGASQSVKDSIVGLPAYFYRIRVEP